jgi:amidophosphoribosyltransferase
MCGIVGLYLKDPGLHDQLGALLAPMLVEMTDRGPDSAGIGLYRSEPGVGTKVSVYQPAFGYDWSALAQEAARGLGVEVTVRPNSTHAVLASPESGVGLREWLETNRPEIPVLSSGKGLETYKELGLPRSILEQFGVEGMAGTHALAHTRMATESAVTMAGAHPFNTGDDLCLVHNGSLSNHHRWRRWLEASVGLSFQTDNDTEVAAAYMTWRLRQGFSLTETLEASVEDLDGFYTFAIGTRDGFAVLRDPIACKHAIIAETEQWVGMSTEYRGLARLPGVEHARVWEPKPAQLYTWGNV